METVLKIRCQLSDLCERVGVACVSGGSECSLVIRRALLRGLFVNVAEHVGEGKYKTVRYLWGINKYLPHSGAWCLVHYSL